MEKYWKNLLWNVKRCMDEEYKAKHPYVEHNPGSVGARIRGYFE